MTDLTAPALKVARLRPGWLVAGAVAVVLAAVAGLVVGPVALSPVDVVRQIVGASTDLDARQVAIVEQIRLPRVVLGLLVGSTLSLCGASYQGVFRNPLADPYLLGVASGAGLGATIAIAYGHGASLGALDLLPLAAFLGALVAVAAAYVLGSSLSSGRSAASLILAGVAVAAFLTAAQTYVQQRHSETLRQVNAWILGGLATAGWHGVLLTLPYVAVATAVIFAHRRLLDVLRVGDDEAGTLGVPAARVRLVVVLAATLGTAAAVSVSGLIGFVGIVVPHTLRLLVGGSYRRLLPLSLVLGAAFLILADLAARMLVSPAELPIGVVTALLGAPFFIAVLRTTRMVGV
jgi:iron complex transport system permease protein